MDGQKLSFRLLFEKALSSHLGLGWRHWLRSQAVEWDSPSVPPVLALIKNGTLSQLGLPWLPDGKESACNTGDQGSIPGLGRSPGEGNGYPLQYSCLENSMDREEPGGLQSLGSYGVGHN